MNRSVVHPDTIVQISGLTAEIGDRAVLRDVELTVRRGELVALVGENGAGKSSLVAALAGVLRPSIGQVTVLGQTPTNAYRSGLVSVVWQMPALVDDLRVSDNILLGREPGRIFLRRRRLHTEAVAAFRRVGLAAPPLRARVSQLSGGQRQAVALAGALLREPQLLVLDEPTSALSLSDQKVIDDLLRRLRTAGVTTILITHRAEQVATLADRVVALRHGQVVSDQSMVELTTDDVVALMSGLPGGLSARRHLTRLSDLLDQLSDIEPAVSVTVILSAVATALGQQQLVLHVTDPDGMRQLRLGASVGLSDDRMAALRAVDLTRAGPISESYECGRPVVREILTDDEAAAFGTTPPASAWSVPIVAGGAVYGVITGMSNVPGHPGADQLEVATLYASLAATSVERERLLHNLARNNRVLLSIRRVHDAMGAQVDADRAVEAGLQALRAETGATHTDLLHLDKDGGLLARWSRAPQDLSPAVLREIPRTGVVVDLGDGTSAVRTASGDDTLVLLVRWPPGRALERSPDVLRSAAWSMTLAIERATAQATTAEALALSRTADLHREFVHRLSHELRTPLTAIVGYASTLTQPDIEWDDPSRRRFLGAIAGESVRLQRLVKDLLDSSKIAAGPLPLAPDWCDIRAVFDAALAALGESPLHVRLVSDTPRSIWGDHDRLEQVFINLLENSARHGAQRVDVSVTTSDAWVRFEVLDDGPGLGEDWEALFLPYVHGANDRSGLGLGLAICRGIVEAHGGVITAVPHEHGALVRFDLPSGEELDQAEGT